MTISILYYTESQLRPEIADVCRAQLMSALYAGKTPFQLVTVSLNTPTPLAQWDGIHLTLEGPRGVMMMHRQILEGLGHATGDYIYMCEHDVLYHPSHFAFVPPKDNTFFYNVNVFKVRYPDGHAVWTDDCQQVSGLVASRRLLLDFYTHRLAQLVSDGFNRHYEPGLKQTVGGRWVENWKSTLPNLCIRHGHNLTPSKWAVSDFRNQKYAKGWKESDEVAGWGKTAGLFKATI